MTPDVHFPPHLRPADRSRQPLSEEKKKLVKAGLPRGDDNSEIDRALHRHPNPQWGGA